MADHDTHDHTGIPGISSGDVATDPIWDAAGDLAVGSGANTAAKLAIGAAGGALSVVDGAVAWNSGTSMPGSPTAGDRRWRTDLGLEFYFDGTRWLTTQLFQVPLVNHTDLPLSVTSNGFRGTISNVPDLDIWLINCIVVSRVATTNNGTHNWTLKLNEALSGSTIGSVSTSANTADVRTRQTISVAAAIDVGAGTHILFQTEETKVNSPGNIDIANYILNYRLIGT